MRKNNGVTLIALIITIIILLILAGIIITQLTGNGIFEKAKLAKMRSEYTSAKETIEIKLMEVQADCIENGKEYTITEIAKNIKEDKEITIEKYYNSNIESIENLSGIVVSVDKYSDYKFLIGKNCKIEGITIEKITATTGIEKFKPIEEFEKEILGKVPSNNVGNNTKEEVKDVPTVGGDVDTTKPIEIQTYMLISSNSKNTLNLANVENAVYTMKEKTDNISLSGITLIANNNANSSDSCIIQIKGTYSGQDYTNNLTVYVEPEKTTVENKEGNLEEAYAILTKDDFIRIKEIIENVNNNCNIKLINNIELNSTEEYEFDENGKITFKETAQKYNTIGSTDRPYEGIFDGDNHTISGLYIKETNTKTTGLFGMISQNAEIRNTTINNSYFSGNRIGGISGYNEGKIYRCKIQNTTIEKNARWTGGIVGVNNGNIVECASISAYMNGEGMGGIAGVNGSNDSRDGWKHNSTTGHIYRCYSTGYLKYTQGAGIASHNGVYGGEGYIYDCYSTAKIEDNFYNGSISSVQSYQGRGGYIYNSYYLNLDCNFPSVATPKYYGSVTNSYSNNTTVTASQLNAATGTTWIDDIQNINNGYPILYWQIE